LAGAYWSTVHSPSSWQVVSVHGLTSSHAPDFTLCLHPSLLSFRMHRSSTESHRLDTTAHPPLPSQYPLCRVATGEKHSLDVGWYETVITQLPLVDVTV
jgi:hypothetical protein